MAGGTVTVTEDPRLSVTVTLHEWMRPHGSGTEAVSARKPSSEALRAARAQARTPEFKRAYPTRSMIERVISWTATQNGRRVKLRYTGTARNDAWLHNRCAAINLRPLLRHGLTRSGGAWVLA